MPANVTSSGAPLWRRVVARLVDMASVFFVLWFLVVVQVLWFMREAADRYAPAPWGRAFAPLCAYLALYAAYEAVFLHWNRGQTPGRQLLGIRVVDARDGSDPSTGRVLARWLVPALALVVRPLWAGPLLLALTAVSLPFGTRRRAVHDLIAGTTVVREQPATDRADDTRDPGDSASIDSASIDSELDVTMTDVLFGRPIRRGLRHGRAYSTAGRQGERG